MRHGWVLASLAVIAAACVFPVSNAGAESDRGADSVFLIPTADSTAGPGLDITALTYLPSLAVQFGLPVARSRVTLMGYAGVSGIALAGFAYASAAARYHLLFPTESRWGFAAQLQALGIIGIVDQESEGSSLVGVQLVASSPVRRFRGHVTAALHTMPGSNYDDVTNTYFTYDVSHPQFSLGAGSEYRIDRTKLSGEVLWGGVGADEGFDSIVYGLFGVRIPIRRYSLRLAGGFLISKFGSTYPDVYPIPPVIMFSIPL